MPPGLTPRISLHVGEVIIAHNPILEREDIFGEAVHLAARLEPVTTKGQVFCTNEFASSLRGLKGLAPVAHELGEVELPKRFGTIKVFAVTGPNEDPPPVIASAPKSEAQTPPAVEDKPLSEAEISAMLRVIVGGLPRPGSTLTYDEISRKCHPGVSREVIARLLPGTVQGTNWRVTVGEATASFEYRLPALARVRSNPPRGYR